MTGHDWIEKAWRGVPRGEIVDTVDMADGIVRRGWVLKEDVTFCADETVEKRTRMEVTYTIIVPGKRRNEIYHGVRITHWARVPEAPPVPNPKWALPPCPYCGEPKLVTTSEGATGDLHSMKCTCCGLTGPLATSKGAARGRWRMFCEKCGQKGE